MVLPIYDDNPFKLPHRPVMTWSLIGANFVIFLLELTSGNPQQMLNNFGIVPASITGEVDIKGVLSPVLTLVTYMFLHADWGHIFGNMLFLWVFGDNVEDAVGHGRFILFYALCGVAGGVAYVLSAPTSMAPLEGASGAIAGVVAAYLMLRPCAKIEMFVFVFPVAMAAYWALTAWIALQVIHVLRQSDDSVAWWAHIGGLTAGALLILGMRRPNVRLFDCRRPPQVA